MSLWENPTNHHVHDFRTWWTCPWFPKTIILNFGDTKVLQILQEKTKPVFEKVLLKEMFVEISKSSTSELKLKTERTRARNHEDPSLGIVQNLEYGINTFQSHELEMLRLF